MTNTENKLIGTRRKSLNTMMAALLAGSLVATAGGFGLCQDRRPGVRSGASSSSASRSASTRR